MGSFYSTCSVSSMTLSHQKTSVQLLSPNYSTDFQEHFGMIVSNDGAQAFFSPFAFPIHGRYDDYGYISDIKRDKNVEMLEEFFGVHIDEILNNIGDNRSIPEGIKNEEVFKKLGMTYYRTEVLEYLQSGWDKIELDNPTKYSSESRIKKLLKTIEETNLLDITRNSSRYLELKSKVDRTEDEIDELYDMMDIINGNAKSSSIRENSYISSLSKPNMFKVLPITIEFKDDILKQYQYIMTLGYELSRLLIPSVYGSQSTNWAAQYNLNNFINELLVNDIKEELDQNYYEDDEDSEERKIVRNHFIDQRDKKINNLLN